MRLSGKRAIVTGGASGIGAAIARCFADEGARLIIADRNLAGATEMALALRGQGADATPCEVDVSVSQSVSHMLQVCVDRYGGLDILVNNAGIVHPDDTDIEATTEAAWDETVAINLKSVFLCSKFAIPAMERGGSSIINIASVVGLLGSYPSQIAYTASKGGVISFTRELAVCLARRGIRVNAICPGLTATPMIIPLVQDDDAYQLRRLHIPMGRLGEPREIATAALFLASDDLSYVTGQAFPVDGGMVGAYLTPPDALC